MNVVVMVLDTLRYDIVHHLGSTRVYIPNLDALRRDSVSFSAAFGEGEPTVPVRRALMTGVRSFPWRYPFDTHGLYTGNRGWHRIPPEQTTLAELLLARGYKTALIADVFHLFKATMNFTRGWLNWEFIRGQENDNWQSGSLDLIRDELGHYVPGPLDPRAHVTLVQYLLNKRAFAQVDPLTSGTVFRRGIEWLRANHDDGPFLLWLEAFDPHEPWDPPRAYADRYCPDFAGTEFIMPHAAPQVASDHEKERIKALYYGEITYLDEWIGRLLNTIADLDHLQDTVILFTSDHGTELLDHGRFGKNAAALHPYNTQLNWLIRHPSGVGAGHEVTAFVQGHDLFPTILDLLDIPAPEYTDAATALVGRSVWPLVRAAAGEHVPAATLAAACANRDVAITGWGSYASVRSRRWSYIVNFECPEADTRLYDLAADPDENRSVAAHHPDVVRTYRHRLEDFLGQELPATLPDHFQPDNFRNPAQLYYGRGA